MVKEKRKFRGPPCILHTVPKAVLREKRAKRAAASSGAEPPSENGEAAPAAAPGLTMKLHEVRDTGLCCLLRDPHDPRGRSILPSRRVGIHNMTEVKSWVLLYLPDMQSDDLPLLDELFARSLETRRKDNDELWGPLGEVLRLPTGPPKGDSKEASKGTPQGATKGVPADAPADSREESHTEPPQDGSQDLLKEAPSIKPGAQCTLESLRVPPATLAELGFPQDGVRLDARAGSGEAFVLDCEMCLSGTAQVLTRVAVLRLSTDKVLLDELVQPDAPITDFVTPYSGITAELLDGVTYTLRDAQAWFRAHVGPSDYLVGHSLDSDLTALQISHDRVIDTTLLYPHVKGLPFRSSLKYLANKHLGWNIQGSVEDGHNPVEDARACAQLVNLVIKYGRELGDVRRATLPVSALLSQHALKTTVISPSTPRFDDEGTADHILETDAARCVDAVLATQRMSDLVCCTFAPVPAERAPSLNYELARLHHGLPPRTLVVALVGTGVRFDAERRRLHEKRMQYRRAYREQKWDEIANPWTAEDDARLRELTHRSQHGVAYFDIIVDPDEEKNLPKSTRRAYPRPRKQQDSAEASAEVRTEASAEA